MKTLELIKNLKTIEDVAKVNTQKKNATNYKIILDYTLRYKDIKFNGSTLNTKAKNEIIKEFMQGGYIGKNKSDTSKPAKAKIDRYAIIFTSKKIQALVKTAKNTSEVSKIFIDNKLTSQGLLLKFAGQKTKTALEILQNGFEKLSDSDQDQAQEFVIWLNAKAKNEGYIATQKEIDAIDTENQKTA